jgi:gliding motility-associated-like protein
MDEQLKHILQSKLKEHSSVPPEHVWKHVSGQIASAPASTSWFAGKSLLVIGSSVATLVAAFIWLSVQNQPESNPSADVAPYTADTAYSVANADTIASKQKTQVIAEPESTTSNTLVLESEETTTTSEIRNTMNPLLEGKTDLPETQQNQPKTPTQQAGPIVDAQLAETPETAVERPTFSSIEATSQPLLYFFIPSVTNASSYSWNFGDGESSTEMSPQHSFDEPGAYRVTLTVNANGKNELVEKRIECFPTPVLIIPTIFTPNGDGKNDRFDPMESARFIELTELQIFDQGGNRVFRGMAWDGSSETNEKLPSGNYLYQITGLDLRQKAVEKRGYIYLQR